MKIVATDTLNLKASSKQGKYDDIIAACTNLKQNQSIVVDPIPEGEKRGAAGYRARLSYKIRNVKTPAGTHLKVRLSADSKTVAVSLVAGERPASKFTPRTDAQKAATKAKRLANLAAKAKAAGKPAMAGSKR